MKIQFTALLIIAVASSAWAGASGYDAKRMANEPAAVAPATKAQTMCPVLDEPIQNKEVYVGYNGQRVYLCCAGCKVRFSKDPEKYIKKLEAEGVQIEKTPTQK